MPKRKRSEAGKSSNKEKLESYIQDVRKSLERNIPLSKTERKHYIVDTRVAKMLPQLLDPITDRMNNLRKEVLDGTEDAEDREYVNAMFDDEALIDWGLNCLPMKQYATIQKIIKTGNQDMLDELDKKIERETYEMERMKETERLLDEFEKFHKEEYLKQEDPKMFEFKRRGNIALELPRCMLGFMAK